MKSTVEIENELKNINSFSELEQLMKREKIGGVPFGVRLSQLFDKYQKKSSDVYNQVSISKSQLAAIINGTRNPSKENVIKISLALGTTVAELNELLKLAGYKELYVKNQDDAIILFGLNNRLKIDEIEELLISKKSKIRLLDED